MSEFAPVGWKPKMTKAQVRQYQKNMQAKRDEAKKNLEEAKKNWDLDNSDEVLALEQEINNLFG